MAKSITQNGITFSNVKTENDEGILGVSAGIKVSGIDGVDPNYGGIINAIDIDWNSAQWPDDPVDDEPSTINTTGELINAIKYASQVGGGAEYHNGNLIIVDTNNNINHNVPSNMVNPYDGDVTHGDPNSNTTLLASITRDKYGHVIDAKTITLTQLKGLLGLLKLLVQSDITYNRITLTAYVNDETGKNSIANSTTWFVEENDNIQIYNANYKLTLQRDFASSYSLSVNDSYFENVYQNNNGDMVSTANFLSQDESYPTEIDSEFSYWMQFYDDNNNFILTINEEWNEESITIGAYNDQIPGVEDSNSKYNRYEDLVTFPSYTNSISTIGDPYIYAFSSDISTDILDIETYDVTVNGIEREVIRLHNNYNGNNDVSGSLTVTMGWDYDSKVWTKDFTYYIQLKGIPMVRYYYSVGTDEVTASNYTTANNAQSVTSLSSIPDSLDISAMKGYVYIVLPTAKEPNVNTVDGGLPNISIVETPIGHKIYKVKVGTNAALRIVNAGSSANLIQ